jgi:transposase
MARQMLSDEEWSKLHAIMRKEGIYDKPNLRNTVEGILYRIRVGCPWRDLPSLFGIWNSVYKRFNEWSKKEIMMNIFNALVSEPDTEWELIDGSIVRAHQHSTGGASKDSEGIGKSCGGNSTKILLAVDAYGLPIGFDIVEGQEHDSKSAPDLIEKLPLAGEVIGDKGFDSDEVREVIRQRGAKPVIPRRSNSKKGNDDMDWGLYKYRHLVENAFARLKHFRAVATRYDKLKRNYRSVVALACGFIWLPM